MNRTIALVVVKAALGAGLALGFAAAPHGVAHADDTTASLKTIRVGRVLTMATRSADQAIRKVYRLDGTTRAACLSIRGQSTPTPTWTATGDPPTEPCESAAGGA